MTPRKSDESKTIIPQIVRDLLLVEIFTAYREVGELLKKSKNPDTTQTLLDIKRGFDLMVTHMAPLCAQSEQHWKQLREQS